MLIYTGICVGYIKHIKANNQKSIRFRHTVDWHSACPLLRNCVPYCQATSVLFCCWMNSVNPASDMHQICYLPLDPHLECWTNTANRKPGLFCEGKVRKLVFLLCRSSNTSSSGPKGPKKASSGPHILGFHKLLPGITRALTSNWY